MLCRKFSGRACIQVGPLVWWICLIPASGLFSHAQQAAPPTVTFTCDFPGSDPSHYVISLTSDGHGSYASDGKIATDSDSDPETATDTTAESQEDKSDSTEHFQLDFTLLRATATRVFDLAKKAHYFDEAIDSKKKNLASTGAKTLAYKDGPKTSEASYNYSPVPAVVELTTLFQDLSMTLEFGRRLDYDLRYQKLALEQELKRMEQMSSEGSLGDLEAVTPILQKIANDQSIINISRARAERLLAKAGK